MSGATPHPAARVVMNSGEISRALRRVAHEILERNKGPHGVLLMGIPSRGVPLARRLAAFLTEIPAQFAIARDRTLTVQEPPLAISIDGEVLAKTPVTAKISAGVIEVAAPKP